MAKQQCTCTICGSQFEFKAHKANLYCGMPCYRAAQRRGDYKRGSAIHHTCTECGGSFEGRGKSTKRNGEQADKIFCGRKCYDTHRAKIVKAERASKCVQCGTSFIRAHTSSGKYCSMACRTAHKRAKPIHCVNCGCWFTAMKAIWRKKGVDFISVNGAKTCSAECLSEWASRNPDRREKISKAFRADKHPNWQGGSHYGGTRGPGWQRIAEKCRDLHGRKCKHCGMDETDSLSRGWGAVASQPYRPVPPVAEQAQGERPEKSRGAVQELPHQGRLEVAKRKRRPDKPTDLQVSLAADAKPQ